MWAGELNIYTRKVSGMTRDRQKQLGPWDRKLQQLFARAPGENSIMFVSPAYK